MTTTQYSSQQVSLEFWMTNLSTKLRSTPLRYLAIPGSHDSFTASINGASRPGPDMKAYQRYISYLFGHKFTHYMSKWLRTQDDDVTEQLLNGIRYLDLRVARDGDGVFNLTHCFISGQVSELMDGVKKFLQAHPKEVILLDFNHFYDFKEMSHYLDLCNLIISTFGSMLQPYTSTGDLSLAYMSKNETQVICFFHGQYGTSPFWSGDMCSSLWPDTQDPTVMVTYLENNYRIGRRQLYGFYVSQGVLTPSLYTILKHWKSGLTYIASEAEAAFMTWIKDKHAGAHDGINICIKDFVTPDYAQAIIALNFKMA